MALPKRPCPRHDCVRARPHRHHGRGVWASENDAALALVPILAIFVTTRHLFIVFAAGAPRAGRLRLERVAAASAQLSDDVVKRLFHIDAVLCGGFDEFAAEFAGERLAFLGRDLALRDAIALIAHEHDGDAGGRGNGGDG